MTWETALSITISDTGTRRYAWLCSDDNPDAAARNAYRQRMLQRANTFPPNQPAPPESDAARAARLIAEFPPENPVGKPCGGCPGTKGLSR